MTAIHFQSGNDTISGNIFAAENPKKLAFLFIQGWTGNQNIVAAEALAAFGFTSMTYDMRGNKQSEGDLTTLTRADFVNDAAIAYDYLASQVDSDIEIGVIGSSFGAYTATLLTELRKVVCLSLRVPATYWDECFDQPQLAQIASKQLTAWRKQPTNFLDNKAFTALHSFTGNVQIIEAECDETVPHQAILNYINAATDKSLLQYHVMRGAPHRLATEALHAEYKKLLTSWVTEFYKRRNRTKDPKVAG